MTAYDVGLPLGFALLPLLGSLAISFAAQTTASWLSHRASTLRSRILAGVLSGGGIIAMHYLGMIGLLAAALRQWNGELIGGSVFLALVLASFAFARSSQSPAVTAPSPPAAYTVRDILGTLMPAARSGGVKLRTVVPRDLGGGVSDAFKIKQCLLNLVSNAVKFSPMAKWCCMHAANHTAVAIGWSLM